MRILHTSDWHLGRSLEQVSRIEEQRQFLDELCTMADREDIDLVLVAGDVFDAFTPTAAAEQLFYSAVDRLCDGGKRAVVIIAGNHDSPERICAASSLAGRTGIIILGYPGSRAEISEEGTNGVRVVDSGNGWLELQIPGCSHNAVILALPYPSEARLEHLLSQEADESSIQKAYSEKIGSILNELENKFREETVNIIVSHLFICGGKTSDSERILQVGGAMTVTPEVFPRKAHFVALGHLHRAQKVAGAPCPTFYSGSPLAYSFSESGYAKEVFIVEACPGNEAEIKEICLNSGRPLVCWTAKNGIEEAFRWCEEGRDKNAWIDLEVYTDRVIGNEELKKLRQMNPGIINIRPCIVTADSPPEQMQNREGRKVDELFRDFYLHRTGTEISEELMGVFYEALSEEALDESQELVQKGGKEDEARIS